MSLSRFSIRKEDGSVSGYWLDSNSIPPFAKVSVLEKGVFEILGTVIDVEARHPKNESEAATLILKNRRGDQVEVNVPDWNAFAVTHGNTLDGEVCAAVLWHGESREQKVERVELYDFLTRLGVLSDGVDIVE